MMIPDSVFRDYFASQSDCKWWIVKFRDPAKRKNARPLDTFMWQGSGSIVDALDEAMQACRNGADLDALTIEARRMTQAEIDKWDRETDRAHRRDERRAQRHADMLTAAAVAFHDKAWEEAEARKLSAGTFGPDSWGEYSDLVNQVPIK